MNVLDAKTCASIRGSESLKEKNTLMNIKIVRKWMLIPNEMVLLATVGIISNWRYPGRRGTYQNIRPEMEIENAMGKGSWINRIS